MNEFQKITVSDLPVESTEEFHYLSCNKPTTIDQKLVSVLILRHISFGISKVFSLRFLKIEAG